MIVGRTALVLIRVEQSKGLAGRCASLSVGILPTMFNERYSFGVVLGPELGRGGMVWLEVMEAIENCFFLQYYCSRPAAKRR